MTMSSVAVPGERRDVRTILTAGITLGLLTVAGVVVFALLSRPLEGMAERIVQALIILAGGAVAAFFPAAAVGPRSIDAIGWSAFIGVIGAWIFTAVDIAVLRPLHLYHWTWDAIGGGSGWWYIPVWWMGAVLLAWFGAWAYAIRARSGDVSGRTLGVQTAVAGAVLYLLLGAAGLGFSSGTVALGVAAAILLQVPVLAFAGRR